MGTKEIQKKYEDDFLLLNDAGSQFEYLVMLGMKCPADSTLRKKENRIGGCKTAIWLTVSGEKETILFESDSDSLLVKGVLMIFRDMYTGRTIEEIRKYPPEFLQMISDEVLYPEIKQNGIMKCYERLAALNV